MIYRAVDQDSPMILDRICSVAVEAAQLAGDHIRNNAFGNFKLQKKYNTRDVVTDLDTHCEKLIIDRIKTDFPEHHVFSEEIGSIGGDERWTWVVDPLDGTNNLAIGLPAYSIGIAVCHNEVPVVGVVVDPLSKHTWSAIRGRGTQGHVRFGAPRRCRVDEPIIAWTQGYSVETNDMLACAYRLLLERGSTRLLQLWAPLMCWVMLVRGDIDAFVGYQVGKTDLFAGMLIAIEAGLTVRHIDGSPFVEHVGGFDEEDQYFVAGRDIAISQVLDLVSSVKELSIHLSSGWKILLSDKASREGSSR